jgi:transposase
VRFEAAAGQQAQVDWAYCGQFKNQEGRMVKVYAFVMILGFSRMIYSCFTTSMDVPSLIRCHKQAFEFFGGLPKEVLYDNMKQVRLSLDKWNPLFLDFANHSGSCHEPIAFTGRGPKARLNAPSIISKTTS